MKLIDLLNNIANDKDLPERIKYDYSEFRLCRRTPNYFDDGYHIDYLNDDRTKLFTDYIAHYVVNFLNDEVEIL